MLRVLFTDVGPPDSPRGPVGRNFLPSDVISVGIQVPCLFGDE